MSFGNILKSAGPSFAGAAIGGAIGGPGGAAIGGQLGGMVSGAMNQRDPAREQYEHQKEFAQHGIRWKVADARKAGIHPLYALGAQTTSFSPTGIGGSPDFSSMGANISDSVARTSTSGQRVDQVFNGLAAERGRLENDLIREQIAASRLATARSLQQPSFPLVNENPRDVMASVPGAPHQGPGTDVDVAFRMGNFGRYVPGMTQDQAEEFEADKLGLIHWWIRNRLAGYLDPNDYFGYGSPPADVPLKPGHHWKFDRLAGGWHQVKPRSWPSLPSGSRPPSSSLMMGVP